MLETLYFFFSNHPLLSGLLIFLFVLFFYSWYTIDQQTVAIIEQFGKFVRVGRAGLNFKIPLVEKIAGYLSLRIQQFDVLIETKTKDNVFIKITVSVQYHVVLESIYEAFYKLTDPRRQIESFVFDVVRAEVPRMVLDDVFEKKDNIAISIKNELAGLMSDFGYDILKALVTNIDPDAKVKSAMNEINEQQRLRMAAQEKGEADKILRVKNAEAEAQSMFLQGEGIAKQRKAIIDGLRQTIFEFQHGVPGVSAMDVMNLVILVQYYDTLKSIGAGDKTNTILLPHSPSGFSDFASQIRDQFIAANFASAEAKKK